MSEKAKKVETEKEDSPKASTKDALGGMWSFSRSALPYVIAALVAATAMAWYFFVFVPGKLEYFVSLRFRTLAVASGHIQSKVENLTKALTLVPTGTGDACTPLGDQEGKYIDQVLPDIQIDKNKRPATAGLRLAVCGEMMATIAWSDLVARASAASFRDFDDLILADENGDVQWQREISTPRIGNLSELVGAPDDAASWSPFEWRAHVTMPVKSDSKHLRSTALLKPVSLGGISSLLLVQAVSVPATMSTQTEKPPDAARHLYVAGLVSRSRLQSQAMRIPIAWLLFFAVPVVILFLALPFVKLATLTAKERFSFVDVVAMTLATVAAVGLGALVPFAAMSTSGADGALDDLAVRIESGLAHETDEVLKLADEILAPRSDEEGAPRDLNLTACPIPIEFNKANLEKSKLNETQFNEGKHVDDECELLEALGHKAPTLDLDVVIWLNDKGEQIRKWTTKAQVTGRAPHRPFDHYRNLVGNNLWKLAPRAKDGTPLVNRRTFTIDPLRAPTTAELGVVFAMPLDGDEDQTKKIKAITSTDSERVFFALNVRPQSVIDSVVPPGYGFAIIAPGGKVLFHSEEGLSLEENFFEEVGSPADVREKAQSRRLVRWTGDYHGRPHRFRMQPISSLIESPWLIVTFQEMEPVLTAIVLQQRATLRLGTLNLLLFVMIVLVIAFYYRIKRRRIRDLTQDVLAPSLNTRRAWFLIALAAIEIVALAFVRNHTDGVYFTFVAVPVTAVLVTLLVRKWPAFPLRDEANRLERARDRLKQLVNGLFDKVAARVPEKIRAWAPMLAASELAVLVIVISALPAIGFVRISQVVKDHEAQERWVQSVQQRWTERQARVRERINGPNFSETTKGYLKDGFAKEVATPDSALRYSYLPMALSAVRPAPGRVVRYVLDWNVLRSTDEAVGASAGSTDARSDWALAPATGMAPPRSVSWASLILGIPILTGFLIAAYWARRRLLPPAVIGAPDLDSLIANVPPKGNEIVLLVGPPRSGKDDAVVRAVSEYAHELPVERIALLDKTVDEAFIKRTLQRVEDKIDAAIQLRGASPTANAPVWIHVSNLEAQLLNEEKRTRVLRLLESLLDGSTNQPPRALVITSTIDPVAHFRELFTEERQGVYTDLVPEVSLGRSALIMSRFRRCYAPIGPSKKPVPKANRANASMTSWHRWWHYDPRDWPKTLGIELDGYRPFVPIRDELRAMWHAQKRDTVPFDELVRAVRLKTEASYELLWASCTRSEKLVLIQLAQEGFVTAQSWDAVAPLVAKGIIVQSPGLTIFNHTFRDFLRGIERGGVVQAWERMEGSGLWVVSGRLIASSLVAGGLFYLTTQDFSVQSLLPILSGTGLFSVPLVRSIFARLPGGHDTEVHA